MAIPHPELVYPLESRPADGDTLEIAPGVRWLRMPLPFSLNHINLWLLADGHGWTLVDTGIDSRRSRDVWRSVLHGAAAGRPVHRVIVTHMHPDHIGLAGWLCDTLDAPLYMTREEYLSARLLAADRPPPPEAALRFYRAAGLSGAQLGEYSERYGQFGRLLSPLPQSYRRLQDGDELEIGGRRWQVLVGRGHSPEHACLYCGELNLLIAGDQILPTISPNIGVWPTEPQADPLADWLRSCRELPRRLPADVLVLPAHGRPYHGLHRRLAELIEEHENGLAQLRELCREPQRVVDVFPALFRGRITDSNLTMAVGESLAHLHYLQARGELSRDTDADGVDRYRLTDLSPAGR